MIRARDICAEAFRRTRMVPDGMPVPGEQIAAGFVMLRELLATLELQHYFLGEQTESTWVSDGRDRFTLGPGGDIDIIRPAIINGAFWRPGIGSVAVQIPAVSLEALPGYHLPASSSAPPTRFAFVPGDPLAEARFTANVPVGSVITLVHPAGIALETLDDTLDLATSYAPLLTYGLAVSVAERYGLEGLQIYEDRFTALKKVVKRNALAANPLETQGGNALSNNIYMVGAGPGGFQV